MDMTSIVWDQQPRDLAGDPAATVALDRARWEATGARFADYEDEIGGTTSIATASVRAMDDTIAIGVVDHGATTTFLLVSGSFHEHSDQARAVIGALVAGGIVESADVLELLPAEHPAHRGEPEPAPTAAS
jgi:hypothetical protein